MDCFTKKESDPDIEYNWVYWKLCVGEWFVVGDDLDHYDSAIEDLKKL